MTTRNKTKVYAEPGKLDFTITRDFNAPRELVFKAFTDPELIVKWLGPRTLKLEVEHWDMRPGGGYKYTNTDNDGNRYGFRGVTHEVKAPELIIQTFEFDGMPEAGHVSLETGRFEELPGGRTRYTTQSVFQTVQDRDGMVEAGMEGGVVDSFERLDDLLETMK